LYFQATWIFGGLDNALREAGFDPERIRRRKEWNEDFIVKNIRQLKNVPLAAKYVMDNHSRLFSVALGKYGSWNRALMAPGVTKRPIPRKTRLGLLRELRGRKERGAPIPEVLKVYLAYYFGSLQKAERELKTNRKLLNGWSHSKIIAFLSVAFASKPCIRPKSHCNTRGPVSREVVSIYFFVVDPGRRP
jgi:hypothetical protein